MSPGALLGALALGRLLIAAVLPITQDEAYYVGWAAALDWGYFDHPPGVAVLTRGAHGMALPGKALAARAGAWAAAGLMSVVLWRFYQRCGLRDSALSAALLISLASFVGLVSGILVTPDTLLALCWVLALHEALAALAGARARWLSAGAAVGLGLLGKYTMVLIGPVFLAALVLVDPRALRTPWPYLGAMIALLIFMPNVLWNAQHDWLTMRFQFGHGFGLEPGALVLPAAALGSVPESPTATAPAVTHAHWRHLAAFVGAQLGLLGALVVPLVMSMPRGIRASLAPPARVLLGAAALFPLGFFALLAPFGTVEPNWPAPFVFGAAPFLALMVQERLRWVKIAAGVNGLLLFLAALHAATAVLPGPPGLTRVLRETHGFAALADHAAHCPGPVFADRYQVAAMINFYRPTVAATQWPGLTRPSEYLRGRIVPLPSLDTLRERGFCLISHQAAAPPVPGFAVVASQMLRDCPAQPLGATARCARPLHLWHLHHYRAVGVEHDALGNSKATAPPSRLLPSINRCRLTAPASATAGLTPSGASAATVASS